MLRENQVLLVLDASLKKWTLPGGHVERGETLASALHRELGEETGVEAAIDKLVGLRHAVFDDGTSDIYVVYLMHWLRGEPRPDGAEVLDARFVGIEEALSDYELSELTRRLIESATKGTQAGLTSDSYNPSGTKNIKGYTLYV